MMPHDNQREDVDLLLLPLAYADGNWNVAAARVSLSPSLPA